MRPAELRVRRAAAQLLSRSNAPTGTQAAAAPPPAPHAAAPRTNPYATVGRLLAVQAQDLRAARLALRARGAATTARDVDGALADGSLVIAWLMRGTLHLIAQEDYGWLHALTAELSATTNRRRLKQLGVTVAVAERAQRVIERTLADDGPQPRALLAERLAAAGIPTEGQITPHLLALTAARGTIALGDQQAFRRLRPARPPA